MIENMKMYASPKNSLVTYGGVYFYSNVFYKVVRIYTSEFGGKRVVLRNKKGEELEELISSVNLFVINK